MRKLFAIALGAALAFSLAASFASDADAARKRAAAGKVCSATNMMGQKQTWRCKANEKCCSGLLGQGTCAPASSPFCM